MPTHIEEMSPGQLFTAAQRMRQLLNPVTWIKQDYCRLNEETEQSCYCLLGAAIAALYPGCDLEDAAGAYEADAAKFIAQACPRFDHDDKPMSQLIVDWNDDPRRTWDEVDAQVQRVVEHYESLMPRGFV